MTVPYDVQDLADHRSDRTNEQVIGQEELFAAARRRLAQGGGVLLHGPAGIGKSTALRALTAEYAGKSRTVLRCSATESESHLPFLAIADLLGPVLDRVADRLPDTQRSALEAALTGHGEAVLRPDGHHGLALRLAVLAAFRALAADGPVLVVADDLQWLDRASSELLGFAARRINGTRVRMLCALRTGTPGGPDVNDCLRALPHDSEALRVAPLDRGQISALLARRGHRSLPRSTVRAIGAASAGNPMFALELGRALAESPTPPGPGEPLPVPTSLRALLLGRLDRLPAETRRTLLVAAAGARPTLALLHAAGRTDAEADVARACALGVLIADPENHTVRFTHPMVPSALYAAADGPERRAVHAALSRVAVDPIDRARHLALATAGADPEVAARLSEAAGLARDRGAPSVAASLGLLAARHAPPDARHSPDAHRLRAAEDALTAGETDLARDIAQDVLGRATEAAERVRAWMVVIDAAGQALTEVDAVFPQALADAGDDPRLLGLVHHRLAWQALLVEGDSGRARQEAALAARLAAAGGDRNTELLSLAFQAHMEVLRGHPDAPATILRALEAPQDDALAYDHNGAGAVHCRWMMMSDRLDEARSTVTALLRGARRRGMVEAEVQYLRLLAETELASGHCGRAVDLARESLRLARDTGIGEAAAGALAAHAEASGGDPASAAELAEEAVRTAERDGDQIFLAHALAALGHVRLLRGDAAGAVEVLSRVRALEAGVGIDDPADGRWHGDLAEALVRTGRPQEARRLVDETRARAVRLRREGVLAVTDRAEALVRIAEGDAEGAEFLLTRSRERLALLGRRLSEGRTLLALADLLARTGRGGAGPREEAGRLFRRCRALPWLRRVEAMAAADTAAAAAVSAVAGQGGGPSAGHAGPPAALPGVAGGPAVTAGGGVALLEGLAAMERQVAGLVMEGATNREIAGRLYVSVKTVEATLTRVYRKLGIRSRIDIVRLTAHHPASG
ncbi:AAA family ATPase [Streptomyces sp. NPDC056600]|uniref:helix-turn-helix transcriptional regulator n=1 Tax=Streptomyces sp. NPDC056600 TaxID=3345874 RepID=UPI003694B472